MKKILIFILFFAIIWQIDAQSLDRINFHNAGSILTPKVQAIIGETFVFNLTSSGGSLQAGGESNAADIATSNTEIKPVDKYCIIVYPNPVQNELSLKITGITENSVVIAIYGINGNMLITKDVGNLDCITRVDVKDLPAGTYLLNCKTEAGVILNSISFIKIN